MLYWHLGWKTSQIETCLDHQLCPPLNCTHSGKVCIVASNEPSDKAATDDSPVDDGPGVAYFQRNQKKNIHWISLDFIGTEPWGATRFTPCHYAICTDTLLSKLPICSASYVHGVVPKNGHGSKLDGRTWMPQQTNGLRTVRACELPSQHSQPMNLCSPAIFQLLELLLVYWALSCWLLWFTALLLKSFQYI